MKNKHEGLCRLCGERKKLTFEHIPPRSAFNDQQVVFQTMQDLLGGSKHTKFRRGIGAYSLCESCNNKTRQTGWRILHVRSNSLLPTREQLDSAIDCLLAGENQVEIVLDDWGIGPTRFESESSMRE